MALALPAALIATFALAQPAFADTAATGTAATDTAATGTAAPAPSAAPAAPATDQPTATPTTTPKSEPAPSTTPQSTTPQSTTPQSTAPQNTKPQSTTPQSATAAPQASADNSALRAKIASVALSQVGRGDNPVVTGFGGLNCNPYTTMVGGFSANSDDCGYDTTFNVRNSNENWCSDFAKWVWQQAGVTQDMNTINAAASSFYQWALDDGQSPKADTGTPQVGDAVVFFGAGAISASRYADHVGLVVAVNADGTVDMVNGDFASSVNVKVEHDTNLTLSTFAPNTWGAGEQWVLVSPPTAAQHPVPNARIDAPKVAVTGTDATFHAHATQQGGSVTGYYWMFGDGRTENATGADVTHVFSTPGTYTVSVTATSSFGTISTVTKNVTVLAASASVAPVASSQVWYSSYPVSYYRFVRSASGLAADIWSGASWLQVPTSGTPSSSGSIAALSYQDAAADSAMTPHAFYRAADGSLAETSLISGAWTSTTLPGSPADGSDVVAAVTASGPAVFWVDASRHLNETTLDSGAWSTQQLTSFPVSASPLALAQTTSGPRIIAEGPAGLLTATSAFGSHWLTLPLPARAKHGATMTAYTAPSGEATVVVNGASALGAHGSFVKLTERAWGWWSASALTGSPAKGSAVAAANYMLPSAVTGGLGAFVQPPGTLTPSSAKQPLGTAVAYLTAGGKPAVTYDDGDGWHTAALPGTATSLDGISAHPIAHQPIQVYLTTSQGPVADTTGDTAPPSGPWTTQALPSAPATFADRVLVYGATPGDTAAAEAAAVAAGLAASQVTSSFAVAWAAVLSGNYLVITSGTAATSALEFNVCGWENPSAEIAGSTPYDYVTAARTTLPGADLFLNGSAATSASGPQRVADLTYFAAHGVLPPGQTSVPTPARAVYACAGSAS
ncbi:hypothetical protein GCM10028798_34780 [Humibacter antri]